MDAAACGPFVPLIREFREMRYYSALTAVLGVEPQTQIDQAVGATLADLGCRGG